MNKYIDAEKLKTEIEKQMESVERHSDLGESNDLYYDGKRSILVMLRDFINSFQQEQQEVDLDEEIYFWLEGGGLIYPMSNKEKNNIKDTAHHFYELGLNIRKED